jgi:CRP-like cAMP-binding protein
MVRSRQEKLELMRGVPLFAGIAEQALAPLAAELRVLDVKRRDEIFHRTDEGRDLYVVVEGSLKAMTTSREGDDVVFEVMGPGDVFGECAMMGDVGRTQTVRAIDSACLLAIDRRDLFALMREQPEVALRLLGALSARVRTLCRFFEDVHFLNLPQRLAKKLVDLANRFGRRRPDGIRIDLALSQEEWGDLVGATRESLNKQLKSWAEAGLVRRSGRYLIVENPSELEGLAREI